MYRSTKTVYDHGIRFRISTADLESYIKSKFDISPAGFFTDNAIMKKPEKKPKEESDLLDDFYRLFLDYLIDILESCKEAGYDRSNIGRIQMQYTDGFSFFSEYDEYERFNLMYGINIWDEDDEHWNGITLIEDENSIHSAISIERDGIKAVPTWKGLEKFAKQKYKMPLKDYLFSLGLVSNERKKFSR